MAWTSIDSGSTSSPISTTSMSHGEKHDVFLSFRGEDTRKSFTDHLYAALNQKGIVAFRDDRRLEKGGAIGPELLKAIDDSKFSIVVFSRNYASSSWCLDELAKIIDSMSTKGQQVFPVFYDVDPSDVRKQMGDFQIAFAKHEENFQHNPERINKWRIAMTTAANISGWDARDRYESELIQDIVGAILERLTPTSSTPAKHLVGIDSQLEKLNLFLETRSDDVRFIGIHGIGGAGKTTIARVLFDRFSSQFEGSSFLANVREVSKRHGLALLQQQLVSQVLSGKAMKIWDEYQGIGIIKSRFCNKRVLVILDDVDDLNQLRHLAGEHNWFGPGSRILVTTRDKHLLAVHGVDKVCEMEGLSYDEALQLFSLNAFKSIHPLQKFVELSKKFVGYASGLPLALEVLGSFLYGRSVVEWTSALQGLGQVSQKGILDRLEISYRGLNEKEKQIFLDVACFFKGMDRDYATKVLDRSGFCAAVGLSVLIDKSLITIQHDNRLWMHDLLQEMGENIVRRESLEKPGKRSRLWADEDIYPVLTKDAGTDAVEVINFNNFQHKNVNLSPNAFMKMDRLRLLRISNIKFLPGLDSLPNELRLLEWNGYPLKRLPSSFQPENIVALCLASSCIEQLWSGARILDNLAFLDLSHCQDLTRIPDLTGVPNLEKLILESCTRLAEVHPSVALLKQLVFLNMKYCRSLWRLPGTMEMESLQVLILSRCSKLKNFPEIKGKMENLAELFLDGTAIEQIPLSINNLTGLVLLNLSNCRNLKSLPDSICCLKSLKTLKLGGCQKLDKLPENLGNLECLEEIDAGATAIESIPMSIKHLASLVLLNLNDCRNLKTLPDSICCLKSLKTLKLACCPKLDKLPKNFGELESMEELDLGGTAIWQPPASIVRLKNLKSLSFRGCGGQPSRSSIGYIFDLLFPMKAWNPMRLCLPPLSGLSSLKSLKLRNCNLLDGMIPNDIGCLSSLEILDLSDNDLVSLPVSIGQLSKLESLYLLSCKRLESLPELPPSIDFVRADDCTSLEVLENPFRLCAKRSPVFCLHNCNRLLYNDSHCDLALEWLKTYLQGTTGRRFHIVLPGSEIPRWFSHQSTGSSVVIEDVPPRGNEDPTFMGFAVCAVFRFYRDRTTLGSSDNEYLNQFYTVGGLNCSLRYRNGNKFSRYVFSGPVRKSSRTGSDHLWLLYLSNDFVGEGSIIFSFENGFHSPWNVEVKRCGARLVYERDLKELDETMSSQVSLRVETLSDSNMENNKSGSEQITLKRNYDCTTEASGSSGSDEKPESKRSKHHL